MVNKNCFCGSAISFNKCCRPLGLELQKATTAEALMRSRYVAYVVQDVDYLIATTHPSQRANYSKEEITFWATSNQWQRLEILAVTPTTVTFKAYYLDSNNQLQVHHEHSRFVFENGEWFYVDGDYFEG
jgi:SEC-C motif-containing protein